ncbi:outer membrane lipoprotein chaperone LolA [Vibrio sp. SCSIO 43136]|uniref:outer membrane lipoprotein chaperone LolA n=1 Tax=Vibrio sp. SCSIO 43136 TaxID=2819101 RepID=UPI0020753ECB|nr:outer membrane lipoprotein chaperone LolA [Vibrio sp. SCSIO 43136]USD64379.1 outer membrane lipoprotein chaperone LolA [Vibrio sp. SCSIO 43136]
MKYWIASLALVSATVFAGAKEELNQRLLKTDGFSAEFEQVVTSPEGEVIQQAEGSVEISRPNKFRWETVVPDETLLVSDGQSLWYFDPFVEQVSIYNQSAATEQTPFVLLTRNQASDWDNYNVVQEGNHFTLTPVSQSTTQGVFTIKIDGKGQVEGFEVVEQDGQTSQFNFSQLKLVRPKDSRFEFVPPVGVEVNDERN